MFELMVAAKLLLMAPDSGVGVDRAKIEARFGRPDSVGTDFRPHAAGGPPDRVVTLSWPQLLIRMYVHPATNSVSLLGVTTTSDVVKTGSAVHIGVDRGTVLRELGGPAFEDENQIVYSMEQDDPDLAGQTVRIALRDDRVVGFDWTYPIVKKGSVPYFIGVDRRRASGTRARPGRRNRSARSACRPAGRAEPGSR